LKWKLNNHIAKFGKDKTRVHIVEAFNDWARYVPLKFREAIDNEKSDFAIDFSSGEHNDGYAFDGPGGTLAHAFFPTDGRIHFDSTEEWTDKYDNMSATYPIDHIFH
jgi:matrix metalloproteinase-17 (membrane-inserted)